MGLCCCKDWRGHLPAPKGNSGVRTCAAGWGPQFPGAERAPPAPYSSCRGVPDPPRGLVRHFSRDARHLPQPWRGFRCGCNSPSVSELRSVRPGALSPRGDRLGAGVGAAGLEESRVEWGRPPSRSAKSTVGAEEPPPRPGPAPPTGPLRLNRRERDIHSLCSSVSQTWTQGP